MVSGQIKKDDRHYVLVFYRNTPLDSIYSFGAMIISRVIDCGFRLVASLDEANTLFCKAVVPHICSVRFFADDSEYLHCICRSVCGIIPIKKGQVLYTSIHCCNLMESCAVIGEYSDLFMCAKQ